MTSKTFVKITNADVYAEIKLLRIDFDKVKSRVKINTWCSATALSLVAGILIGFLIK